MNLEALLTVEDRTLQPDVGKLETGAGVRAAVHVDRDRGVELRKSPRELLVEVDRAHLGLDDGQLAELDARAGHHPAPEDVRTDAQVPRLELGDQRVDLVVGDVADDDLLLDRHRHRAAAVAVCEVCDLGELRAAGPSGLQCEADVAAAVLLATYADMVPLTLGRLRRGSVRERATEELLLQHLAELLRAPVGDEELQASAVARLAVAVVTEQPRHRRPDFRDLIRLDEDAEALREHRVGRQPAADPQVEPDSAVLVLHADERDVVDLVRRALHRATADRGLVLAREVGELFVALGQLVDRTKDVVRVDDLLVVDTGQRAAQHVPGRVTTRLGGRQTDAFEPAPDLGHVLDADPVQLHVLPVGDVSDVAAELPGDAGDDPQLVAGQRTAGDTHPEHEVLVVEILRFEDRGLAAVDALTALGV